MTDNEKKATIKSASCYLLLYLPKLQIAIGKQHVAEHYLTLSLLLVARANVHFVLII